MHPVQLIAQAIYSLEDCPALPVAIATGICAVTGDEGATIPRKELLGKSFTDGALLKAPQSDRVSVEAYTALAYKWERMSSWICDGHTFQRLDRQGVRAAVFGPAPSDPWTAYATTSYKKHGAMRARVNGPGQRVWLFESRLVDCSDSGQMQEVWQRLNAVLRQGFGRSVIESLNCPPWLIKKNGIKEWLAFDEWARPRYKSALYAFMCYLLPSQEELKSEQAG
jgi:hypothetical protein